MDASSELEQLKAEIEALAEHRNSRRYSPELKARVTKWARARVADGGGSIGKLSDELGMGEPTLNRFLNGEKAGRKKKSAGFKRLRVTAPKAAPDEQAVVRGPCGVTVEGLSINAVAKLLARLSCSG